MMSTHYIVNHRSPRRLQYVGVCCDLKQFLIIVQQIQEFPSLFKSLSSSTGIYKYLVGFSSVDLIWPTGSRASLLYFFPVEHFTVENFSVA